MRQHAVALLLVLAALAVVAAPATAQLPGAPADGVRLRADAERVKVSLDAPGETGITVTRLGQPTGTPLDMARTVRFSVQGAPAGWVVSVDPPTLTLMPAAAGKTTLRVAISAGAPEKADLTLVATLAPGNPTQTEMSSSLAIPAERAESLQRTVLESNGTIILLACLGLAAALVVVLSVLAAQRRVAVRLQCDDGEPVARGGSRTAVTVRVANLLRGDDHVYLAAFGAPDGWNVKLDPPTMNLDGREQREANLSITPPRGWDGEPTSVFLRATSGRFPRRPARAEIHVRGRDR